MKLKLINNTKIMKSKANRACKINISSPIKLPTSFSGLTNIIDKTFEDLSYIKSWYCGICIKKFI